MTRRANRLLILALAVISMTLYYGCTQTDDILTPVSHTTLTLSAQLLPTAPDGMVYELWVVGDGDTVAVGRFNFDQNNYKFLNENGSTRAEGGTFDFNGDLFDYSDILVTVELMSDPTPASPGPIMLTDRVTNPENNPIRLVFPLSDSLWFSTCWYNMQTPSDGSRSTNIGAGLWFCRYELDEDSLRDTVAVSNVSITDSTIDFTGDTCFTTFTSVTFDTVLDTVVWGFDTIYHTAVRWSYDSTYDTCGPPYIVKVLDFDVDTSATVGYVIDSFLQGDFGLIDYANWHYKGWVMSPVINSAGASLGSFTLPAWPQSSIDLFVGATDGGMLSTGTFSDIEAPDNGNPYSLGPRVPRYPGEDFLQNLPNGAAAPLNLMPNAAGNSGYVFITLEPSNYTDTTTNFPLIVLGAKLPSSRAAITGTAVQQPMDLYTNTNNPTLGFPRIDVAISRQ